MNREQVVEALPTMEPQPPIARDDQGRFIQGNKGGPGNPFARQVALLRSILLRASSEQRMRDLVEMLWTMALDGNLAAVKLILQYTLGKPAPATDPDRVEIDDWNLKKESAVLPAEMLATPLQVMSERANRLCEIMWPPMEVETLKPFKESMQAAGLAHEHEQATKAKCDAKRAQRRARKEQRAERPLADSERPGLVEERGPSSPSAPPSPNGFFDATLDHLPWLNFLRPSTRATGADGDSTTNR